MSFFKKVNNPDRGIRNIIKSCFSDFPNLFIKKAELEDFNDRSKILVNQGEKAVFVVNGQIKDIIEPSNESVRISNNVFFANIKAAFYGGARATVGAVYYIRSNTAYPLGWGTASRISFCDSTRGNTSFTIGGNGTYEFRVDDAEKIFRETGIGANASYSYDDLCGKLGPEIGYLFGIVLNEYFAETGNYNIPQIQNINQRLYPRVKEEFEKKYGLVLTKLLIGNIDSKDSEERNAFRQMEVQAAQTIQEQDLGARGRSIENRIEDEAQIAAINREGLKEKTIRSAIAEGQLMEIKTLGENYWKLHGEELIRIALSNQGTPGNEGSALTGFSPQKSIIESLIHSMRDLINISVPDSSLVQESRPLIPTENTVSSDLWGTIPPLDNQPYSSEIMKSHMSLSGAKTCLSKEQKDTISEYTDFLLNKDMDKDVFMDSIADIFTYSLSDLQRDNISKFVDHLIKGKMTKSAFISILSRL